MSLDIVIVDHGINVGVKISDDASKEWTTAVVEQKNTQDSSIDQSSLIDDLVSVNGSKAENADELDGFFVVEKSAESTEWEGMADAKTKQEKNLQLLEAQVEWVDKKVFPYNLKERILELVMEAWVTCCHSNGSVDTANHFLVWNYTWMCNAMHMASITEFTHEQSARWLLNESSVLGACLGVVSVQSTTRLCIVFSSVCWSQHCCHEGNY